MKQTPLHRLKQSLRCATLAGTLIGISWFIPNLTAPAAANLEESYKTLVDEVWQMVNNQYVDPEFNQDDWESTREELLERDYESREDAYRAIREALGKLDDADTRFLEPEQFESLQEQTSGELSGVGLQLAIDEESQTIKVVEPLENSPAKEAGVEPGDEILAIDGQPTSLLSLEQASELIRGDSGTDVDLKLSRAGEGTFNLTLTRTNIEIPRVTHELREIDQTRVGYIQIEEFSSHAADQMRNAILDLQDRDAEAFVLDLRNNPGGLLYGSIEMARMWLEQGEIVSVVDRTGGNRNFGADQTSLSDLPLAVLVNENSASASEILAGALQDNDRAVVVGDQTYGKGTVQAVNPLSDGSGIALTVARYYLPDGRDIDKKGIDPDIEVSLEDGDQMRLSANPELQGTEEDPQFTRALSILNQSLGKSSTEAHSFLE
ncbi:PDZ domain-containing protein [Euhalothece natronophila Z-M001]|uniref:PDZ domain-containing protein n=1 Tax=Euhalothece natronophila Z-M001 TaxID=522448 RepID=A0A5B8NQB7_9CHRO|nr:S41 family peptidase [Euhalothece natronophila]QDZ41452.1 PDZ domain-containing protein [Euhalothece natronophila Z-M001]